MPSDREQFWNAKSYAVVGDSAKRRFPKTTYNALKNANRTVVPIDPSEGTIEGDKAYPDFTYVQPMPEAAVIEVPKEETESWVEKAAAAGIKKVWIHMGTDTPEALAAAEKHGMQICSGTCAVMYTVPGFTGHSVHRGIMKVLKKY